MPPGGGDQRRDLEPVPLAPDALQSRFVAAQAVAAEAGRLACRFLAEPQTLGVSLKGPQDVVTAADVAVERYIVQKLTSAFPGDSFLAEENYAETPFESANALWVIDPIDGTNNYAGGRSDWCVSIGFMHRGQPTIGVIDIPVAGEQYAARRGQGATRNGAPVRVSNCTSVAQATFGIDYSFRHPAEPYFKILQAIFGKKGGYRCNGSSAVSLAHVAGGRLDGFIELHLYPWDVMAGLVLIEEAGGWVCDFIGQGGMKGGAPMIASAAGVRDELLALLEPFVGRQ
jgi:myo-inositol-1(or 4)-monophosphatase